ncbi:hypothetical protein [Microbacterium sp. MYb66]|jgi:hypothetical protein|uniref:hypothetical protein n=1 Tax=Microbacterium sp. MYb66 TaxID=1848692 RepID=UPI0021585AE8|nr:hypothetical protein [Microbacterium sp. MYb66]
MSDARVGQLQLLSEITRDQLTSTPARRLGILGIAGGNGLDVIDPEQIDAVFGYDINADYLVACAARFGRKFGDRLVLTEACIDGHSMIEPVGLLIANLFIEYVGLDEFLAFLAANAGGIGVVSCVIQRNQAESFVSSTEQASAFNRLSSIASDIDVDALENAMVALGFLCNHSSDHALPNGKALLRRDFLVSPVGDS